MLQRFGRFASQLTLQQIVGCILALFFGVASLAGALSEPSLQSIAASLSLFCFLFFYFSLGLIYLIDGLINLGKDVPYFRRLYFSTPFRRLSFIGGYFVS
jgi:hypothetical protein